MHLLAERFVFLGVIIEVFWWKESRPIWWHQCRRLTCQLYFCFHIYILCKIWTDFRSLFFFPSPGSRSLGTFMAHEMSRSLPVACLSPSLDSINDQCRAIPADVILRTNTRVLECVWHMVTSTSTIWINAQARKLSRLISWSIPQNCVCERTNPKRMLDD